MGAGTSLPAVKTSILAAIAAAAEDVDSALHGVLLARGREPEKREYIWLWKGTAKRAFKNVGPRPAPLDEDLEITLRVVTVGGADPEGRVFELEDAAEEALRLDEDLKGVVMWHHIERLDDEPLEFDQKLGWALLMTLKARSRI